MSTDYAEKERDFIASLNEDTGRDLDGWMAAISESGFSERNAIIDWLRHPGVPVRHGPHGSSASTTTAAG